jgi:nucleoside phosphorylase
MPDPQEYTIGCICALVNEAVALRTFLDEEHEFPEQDDDNNYTAGSIGAHKVVIATLPFRSYGIAEAAGVIRDMVRSFPNLRCCLMVGIGGGAPIPDLPDHDVRLGDVVVGAPVNDSRSGGVLQWDHGKTIQDQQFGSTQHLNGPPRFLMSAIHKLIQNHQLKGSPLRNMVNEVLAQSPHLAELGYQRPEGNRDQLFKSKFLHVARPRRGCSGHCDSDPSNLVTRRSRDLKVHYGVIGSGSSVMKDAMKRDELAESENILCFEMEVAGLVNHFPCLVIRGICDYSDTHKNDEWHGYAAMMAAAYTKELLRVLQPRKVSEEEKLSVSLEGECSFNINL